MLLTASVPLATLVGRNDGRLNGGPVDLARLMPGTLDLFRLRVEPVPV